MEKLLKYFETLYKLSDVLYDYSYSLVYDKLDTSEYQFVEKRNSIADDERVIKFFKTLLDYYYEKTYYQQTDIPLNHSAKDIKEEVKFNLIKKLTGYFKPESSQHEETRELIEHIMIDKAAKMYDLMDYIFLTLKKVLLNTKKGYNKALKIIGPNSNMDFRKEISNISMYLYITFIHVFPPDLRLLLKKELKIDDLDQKIMDKCHGIIIRHNHERVCNIKLHDSPTPPIKSPLIDAEEESTKLNFLIDLPGHSIYDKPDIELKSKYSIGMLFNIFAIIQGQKRL
jgi:hypothetical protein